MNKRKDVIFESLAVGIILAIFFCTAIFIAGFTATFVATFLFLMSVCIWWGIVFAFRTLIESDEGEKEKKEKEEDPIIFLPNRRSEREEDIF